MPARLVGLEDPMRLLRERVWPNLKVDFLTGCWEWQKHLVTGYGIIKVDGGPHYMHRLMYEVYKGSIPVGLYVCHTCDNKKCCNPAHLFTGTQKENIQDASKKGKMRGRPQKTHCPSGHEFTPDNIYTSPRGWRSCKECRRLHSANWNKMLRRQYQERIHNA